MVSAEELEDDNEFNDIKEDVKTECSDHGEVLNVLIPRYKDGYSTGTVGYIFVEFARSSDARTAAIALNGRKFAEKIVEVTYVSFSLFSVAFENNHHILSIV